MGFFIEDDSEFERTVERARARAQKTTSTKKKAASFDPAAVGCDHCALRGAWPRLGSACMKMFVAEGDIRQADVLVLGASPNTDDDRDGRPWQAGERAKIIIKALGNRSRHRLAFQNMVRCSPGELPAAAAEFHACSTYLTEDVLALRPKVILGIGPEPLARFWPGASLTRVHGARIPVSIGGHAAWFVPIIDPAYLIEKQDKFRGVEGSAAWAPFQADIKFVLGEMDRWPNAEVADGISSDNVLIAEDEATAREMLACLEPDRAIDIETNMLRPYEIDAQVLMASVSDGIVAIAWAINHPEASNDWGMRLLIEEANKGFTAHNIGFEYMWIKFFAQQLGIELDPPSMDCTQAAARVHFSRETILNLEMVSMATLGVNVKSIMGVDPKNILAYPIQDALKYCGLDTLSTARILPKLRASLERRRLMHIYEHLVEAARTTGDMALLGLPINLEESHAQRVEWLAKAEAAEKEASTLFEIKGFNAAEGKRWQISSAQDVGVALVKYGRIALPKTGGGNQFATDDVTLEKNTGQDHPLVKAVLSYREAAKIVGTYLDPVLAVTTRFPDGLLHPCYSTTLTATLRTSSEDPNVQNFPKRRHVELRRQIVAPPGHVLVRYDYKALEARVIGMITNDRALCDSIILGVDIHSQWRDKALEIYPDYYYKLVEKTNKPAEDRKGVLKGGRDVIKTDFVFASFYGSTVRSVAERTGMSQLQAQELSEDFWRTFADVLKWIKRQRQLYRDTGSITMLTGLERHAILWGNEPLNNPVQGVAAHIANAAMNELAAVSRKRRDPYFHPRINIHDDLTFILPIDSVEQYIEEIMPVLVRVRFPWQTVPLAVEGAMGDNWADMHEFCNFEGPYNR